MSLQKKLFVLILLLLFFFIFITVAFAAEENGEKCNNCFVTIANPVRISSYTKDPGGNILSQYEVLKLYDLSATWLFDYNSLNNNEINGVSKNMDDKQEFGVFLEVTPELAAASGVTYNNTGNWHHATSIFLSGYLQGERVKMIDTLFEKFKTIYGEYPTSVGSWWTDSYSLSYMKERYAITANLSCADQIGTDGYTIWGQYWSTPYYPSKLHAGIPASHESVKLDIVTTQWAARDPWKGYESSLYSTQDYFVNPVNKDTRYFEELVKLYSFKGVNEFGHITVGLEADLSPDAYKLEYKNQMEVINRLYKSNQIVVLTMKDFSSWYRNKFRNLSPAHLINKVYEQNGEGVNALWYQSPHYRIGILRDNNSLKVVDYRTYHRTMVEPYYLSPNKEFALNIYIPSYFDKASYYSNYWDFGKIGKVEDINISENEIALNFGFGKKIVLDPQKITFQNIVLTIPKILAESKTLKINKRGNTTALIPKDEWMINGDGAIYKNLSVEALYFLKRRRVVAFSVAALLVFLAVNVKIIFSGLSERKKLVLLSVLIVPITSFIVIWWNRNSENYYISQGEMDTMYQLSVLPQGKVLVYSTECLGCEWHTPFKPAMYLERREYVRIFSGHPVVYNKNVFKAETPNIAKKEFEKTDASYIYLAKYGDSIEKVPFSPGDLNIEKVYSNANAELWRVKS